jgi:hypothetical protein
MSEGWSSTKLPRLNTCIRETRGGEVICGGEIELETPEMRGDEDVHSGKVELEAPE